MQISSMIIAVHQRRIDVSYFFYNLPSYLILSRYPLSNSLNFNSFHFSRLRVKMLIFLALEWIDTVFILAELPPASPRFLCPAELPCARVSSHNAGVVVPSHALAPAPLHLTTPRRRTRQRRPKFSLWGSSNRVEMEKRTFV